MNKNILIIFNCYIISNDDNNDHSKNNKELSINTDSEEDDINSIQDINEAYKIWLKNLIILMNSCSYRKVLKEIENNKNNFNLLDIKELWKYKIIKVKAILRIIRIKLDKYSSEIKRENTHQNKSIKFWFNQVYFIFEDLINIFGQENNNNIDKNSIDIIKPIQNIIENYLQFLYLIIMFHKETNELAQICVYLSCIDNLIPFMGYSTDFNSIFLLQKLLLFRAKISLQNRNYILSLEYQKKVIKLCFRILLFITNSYIGLNNIDMSIKNPYTKKIYNTFVNLLLAFYLKGVTCQQLGDITRMGRAYMFCKWIYFNFLLDDNELLGVFISKIESNAVSQIKIMNDIRKIIENKKKLNKNLSEKNKISSIKIKKNFDKQNKLRIEKYPSLTNIGRFNNKYINNNINTTKIEKFQTEKLESYLDNIGKKLYKEEENRNNNLIKKFTKSSFIVSTMSMINNLLSKDFKKILLKMNKIEITKPKEDIKSLINKTIIQKRRQLFNNKLLKSRRIQSCINIHKENYENNNISCKSSLIKNEVNNNFKKRFKIYLNRRKINNINTSSSINNNYYEINNKNSTNQTTIKKVNIKKIKYSFNKNFFNQEKNNKKNLTNNPITKLKIKNIKNRSNSQKVLKYHFDKYEFSKNHLKKKNYIDKYFDKEIDFHKKLLHSKAYEIKKSSDIDFYNQKRAKYSAEREFDIIFNIEKNKYERKEMESLLNIKQLRIINEMNTKEKIKEEENDITTLKMEKEMINARKKRQRRLGIVELNQKKLIYLNNEGKMKKLSVECDEISNRQKKIKNQRRNIILKIGNRK